MIPILVLILLPIVSYLLCFHNGFADSSKHTICQVCSVLINLVGSFLIIALYPYAEFGSINDSFFSLNFRLTPFHGAIILYFILAYSMTSFLTQEISERSFYKSISRVCLTVSAICLALSADFYTILIFSTAITVSLLVANNRGDLGSKVSTLHFYMRKELSDFFLLIGLLLLSYKQEIYSFNQLQDLLDETDDRLVVLSLSFITAWFFIRLRIFPFLSLRQSYFKSIGNNLQALFMTVYLPSVFVIYYFFAPYIDQFATIRTILVIGGVASVISYSILAFLSDRIDSTQTFYIYSYFGLIPLAIGLGVANILSFHLIYMCAILGPLVYLHSFLREKGISKVDELAELKYQYPVHAVMLIGFNLLLIGFPLLGLSPLRYQLIWSALHEPNSLWLVLMLVIAHLLMTVTTFRYLYYLLKQNKKIPWYQQMTHWRAAFCAAILIPYIGLGTIALQRVLWDVPNLILTLFSSDISDNRLLYYPRWAAYVTLAAIQVIPLIIAISLGMMVRRNSKLLSNVLYRKKLSRILEVYVRTRSQGYGLSLILHRYLSCIATTLLKKVDLRISHLWTPLLYPFERLDQKINRNEIESPHAHFMFLVLGTAVFAGAAVIVIIWGLKL